MSPSSDPVVDRPPAAPAADRCYRPGSNWGQSGSLSDAAFAPAVARHHVRFDAADCENVYVVGDVHGCIAELRALWDELSPTADDVVVFVGDLVRKGPDSRAVVEFVVDRPNAVSVLGNNEAKVLRGDVDAGPFEPIRDAVESFPLAVSWGDAVAVHGGVRPGRPLDAHGPDDLLEARSVPPGNGYEGPFWFERHEGPPRVFFGHTVLADPFVSEWAVGLDTGCVYGGALTACDVRTGELVSVPAAETYQSRPDRKFAAV